jgi:hypothetical protein
VSYTYDIHVICMLLVVVLVVEPVVSCSPGNTLIYEHVTPLYPQKLALTSPTGGGRSVGIVRSRTKATEFIFL